MIQRIGMLIAAVAVAFAVGYGAGYYTKGQFSQAKTAKEATQAVKQAGANIVQSAEESQRVEASIQQPDNTIDQLKKAAAERLKKGRAYDEQRLSGGVHAVHADQNTTATQESTLVELPDGAGTRGGDRLDFGTVRLLNRARE